MGNAARIGAASLTRELSKSAKLLDRFRRPILEGCGYTVNMGQPPVYTVEEITPVLDRPDLPRGTFRVRLAAEMTIFCTNHVPVDELALCAMPLAVQQSLTGSPAEPPPAAPPTDPGTTESVHPAESPDAPAAPEHP